MSDFPGNVARWKVSLMACPASFSVLDECVEYGIQEALTEFLDSASLEDPPTA
jgi:hypothetical protein